MVTDLSATRSGNDVELQFTVPALSTDGQPLRAGSLTGVLCRQDEKGVPCLPVDAAQTVRPLPIPGPGASPPVVWTDALPESLRTGAVRPIAYRVELRRPSGGSVGFSDPVYTAAGAAPPPVRDLQGEGTRLGVMLHWLPAAGAGEVMLRRTASKKVVNPTQRPAQGSGSPTATGLGREKGRAKGSGRVARSGHPAAEEHGEAASGVIWLQAAPGVNAAEATIDNSIEPGVPYRYMAVRREQVQVGSRTLVLESSPSPEVAITWRDVYAPAAPTGLTALGYEVPSADMHQPLGYAVDLVWEPVEDGQLAGYLVYRQTLGAGQASAQAMAGTQLTSQPVATPGYHDATALPGQRYRYSVLAVGANGQKSGAATAVVEPHVIP